MEDLKARYYEVVRRLIAARTPPGQEPQDVPPSYDCEHEKNRKEQLIKLFDRTPEEVEEEEVLVAQLKKIESRKKEREKKSHDLNKLITAAESKPHHHTSSASSTNASGETIGTGASAHTSSDALGQTLSKYVSPFRLSLSLVLTMVFAMTTKCNLILCRSSFKGDIL